LFGYALVFGEDGRPMHKSWGNAIEFDEAADRRGVDVMRWLFASARPEDNIRFGWHAADEARHIGRFIDDLSTWYLRLSRKRMSRGTGADRDAAFATLHATLVALARVMAPILPFMTDAMYRNLVV